MANDKGLNSARNPGSISNEEHNDATGANRSSNGELLAIQKVIPNSTQVTAIQNQANLRVCNTGASVAYLWAGKENEVPATLDASNSIALPANYVSMIFVGKSDDDMKSLVVKASNSAVQIVVMKP